MDKIIVRNAHANNLKHVDVDIPLGKLVAVVGKSGSGKSSFVYDILYKASQGEKVDVRIQGLPRVVVLEQRVKAAREMSLCETSAEKLRDALRETRKGDLLIVDEPCAGMAKEDRINVLTLLRSVIQKGASVLVVEHSKDIIVHADYVIEFGPESGSKGGEIVFQGPIKKYRNANTPTSMYVFSNKAATIGYERSPNKKAKSMQRKSLTIKGITKHHLHQFDFQLPLSRLVCVTGRVGTGKTSLLSVVYGALAKDRNAWKVRENFSSIEGKTNVRRAYFVDQTPLSTISTSTPATYVGVWTVIRDVMKKLPRNKQKNLSQMTIDNAVQKFSDYPIVVRKLGFLQEVGLGYLELGQKSNTLSGGEAQRVRLAKILSKKLGDRCVYVLDTPSRGLHLSDLPVLVRVLQKIIDKNNTVLIAENREELIQNCDEVVHLKNKSPRLDR